MTKNAYLLVTDLHFDFLKANRKDYFGEIVSAMDDIIQLSKKYKEQGYTATLILLGDVFDGSTSNSSDAMQALELFRYFCSEFDKVYSVVGNHEISYAKDNPFWFLVSTITDDALARIRRYIQPRGILNTIEIPATIVDGEVTIYFNHYGTSPKVPTSIGVNIGIFHQNVGSNDICKMWGTFDDVEEASYVQAYNYCFFGHMHLAKGRYYLNEQHTCCGEWLGSIGRTKIPEILDDSLEVNVPAILVQDGAFQKIEDNHILLKSFDECVDKLKLAASAKSKKLVIDKQKFSANKFKGDTLLQTLEGAFAGTPNGFLLTFLNRSFQEVLYSYQQTLDHPVLENEVTTDEQ